MLFHLSRPFGLYSLNGSGEAKAQPILNQWIAATNEEQTGAKATLIINVLRVFRETVTAHNGLVPGSSPGRPTIAFFCPPAIPNRMEAIPDDFLASLFKSWLSELTA